MEEIKEYIKDLCTPHGGEFLVAGKGFDWGLYGDSSVHGLVLEGESTEDDIKEAYRVLKPGGHVFLIPEGLGHQVACVAESLGFEVRDSILVIDEPRGFVYSGKTSTREREAGTHLIEEKDYAIGGGANKAIERGEDYEACQSVGMNRISKRRNTHPTVKPRAVMQFLLSDVETGKGPILDPFMGSGTTGLACLRTGHDFIGIEMEEDYARIADSRIRHWTNSENPWEPVLIESEVPHEEEDKTEKVSFTDILGL